MGTLVILGVISLIIIIYSIVKKRHRLLILSFIECIAIVLISQFASMDNPSLHFESLEEAFQYSNPDITITDVIPYKEYIIVGGGGYFKGYIKDEKRWRSLPESLLSKKRKDFLFPYEQGAGIFVNTLEIQEDSAIFIVISIVSENKPNNILANTIQDNMGNTFKATSPLPPISMPDFETVIYQSMGYTFVTGYPQDYKIFIDEETILEIDLQSLLGAEYSEWIFNFEFVFIVIYGINFIVMKAIRPNRKFQ